MRDVYIYHDNILNPKKNESDFIGLILEYLDTPQYLRKKLYPKMDLLKHAGKLHPLRTPHHRDKIPIQNVKDGECRVGIIEKKNNRYYVDVGLDKLITYNGNVEKVGTKLNIKLKRMRDQLYAINVQSDQIPDLYWGYKLRNENLLNKILEKKSNSSIILTSRNSKIFNYNEIRNNISKLDPDESILIVFGSPKFGLDQIFKKEKINIQKYKSFNFFPNQGTKTVRLEESVFGVLSILNYCLFS